MDVVDAAEPEDAPLPEHLQGIAEGRKLPLLGGVGGVEDQSAPRLQEADGDALAAVPLQKLVGDSRPNDTIDPALQDRWRLPPPVGVDDDDPLGGRDLVAVAFDDGIEGGAPGDLGAGEDGVEPLGVEVVEGYLVAVFLQRVNRRLGYGVVEASGMGMAEDDGYSHVTFENRW